MKRWGLTLLGVVVVGGGVAAAIRMVGKPPPGVLLREVTDTSGLSLRNLCGSPEKPFIIESNGSGAALLDHDLDGDLDIYIVNGSSIPILRGVAPPVGNALYRNEGDWRFTDVTAEAGVGDTGWGYGAAVGDIDNDGDPDLFVSNFGADVLYRNRGDGTFEEVGGASGVDDDGWGESAAFGDIDNDGDLDLYLTRKLQFDIDRPPRGGKRCPWRSILTYCGPRGLPAVPDILYRNDGTGRFEDVSVPSGIRAPEPSYGLGVLFWDYDDDGWADVFVANDSVPNFLFHNLGSGRFEEVAMEAGVAVATMGFPQASMGIDAGDVDGDGRPDLVSTSFSHEYNTIYRNEGGGSFMDITTPLGLDRATWYELSWGAGFVDFDCDGDLDIYIANGHVFPNIAEDTPESPYEQPDHLFMNDGGGKFRLEMERIHRTAPPKCSRGAAFGDIDNDGDIDVVVVEIDDTPTLLRNDLAGRSHWVLLRLVGDRSNREGAGARVWLTAGGRTQRAEVTRGGSYCSSSDPRLHFGLGEASTIDRVEIHWPAGTVQVLENLPPDREITIREEGG